MKNLLNNNIDLRVDFIEPKDILKYVSEEEIYQLVFGFLPVEYDLVRSPFRKDNNPGAYFERDAKGKLRFKDFANGEVIKGTKMISIDCFDAVRVFFNLPNFYSTLLFIKNKLIDSNSSIKPVRELSFEVKEKKKFYFRCMSRNFNLKDKDYWTRFGITKQNLIDDKVFPVEEVFLYNTKKGDTSFKVRDLGYCFTDFKSNHKKLYIPKTGNNDKIFITDCDNNDIGGITKLKNSFKKIIISKSYKDYRVLKNLGLEVIWLQSENSFPSMEVLLPLLHNYTEVIIFFDNDNAGILNSKFLSDLINSFFPNKSRVFNFPEKLFKLGIKDPADFYEHLGREELMNCLLYYHVL